MPNGPGKKMLNSNVTVLSPGQILSVPKTGALFVCKESTDQFEMSYDGGPMFEFEAGLSFKLEPGQFFTELTFLNPTGNTITIEYYVGTGQVIDARLNTIISRLQIVSLRNAPTYTKGRGDTVLDAAGGANPTKTFNGLDGANVRKQIVIRNRDAANPVDYTDAQGALMGQVLAGQAETLETSGTIIVSNPNGAPLTIRVGETYYS